MRKYVKLVTENHNSGILMIIIFHIYKSITSIRPSYIHDHRYCIPPLFNKAVPCEESMTSSTIRRHHIHIIYQCYRQPDTYLRVYDVIYWVFIFRNVDIFNNTKLLIDMVELCLTKATF